MPTPDTVNPTCPPPTTLRQAFVARIRAKHYARSTESCYWGWIREYCRHHRGTHPRELQPADMSRKTDSTEDLEERL